MTNRDSPLSSNASTISVATLGTLITLVACQPGGPARSATQPAARGDFPVPGASASSASARPGYEEIPQEGVVLATYTVFGRDVYPASILTEEQAKGRQHERVYREHGRTTKSETISAAGKVTEHTTVEPHPEGGIRVHVFNAHDIETTTVNLLASGRETRRLRSGKVITRTGCAALQHVFTDQGLSTEMTCLDEGGNAAPDEEGCEVKRLVLDARRMRSRTSCFDAHGHAIRDSNGIHATVFTRDSFGKDIAYRFVDTQDQPTARLSDGCWGWKNRFDRAGLHIAATCVDAQMSPATVKGAKHATTLMSRDENGCLLRTRWENKQGLRVSFHKIFETANQRNESCDLLSYEQRDESGKLSEGDSLSTPSYVSKVDSEGREIERRCFDTTDTPTNCNAAGRNKNPTFGVMVRRLFDERGRSISEKYFYKDGSPSPSSAEYPHESRSTWDDNGSLTGKTFFDEQGKPALGVGVARLEFGRDALGLITSEKSFGVKNEPALTAMGYHEMRYLYDIKHRRLRVELRGIDGNLVETSSLLSSGVTWPKGSAYVEIERGTTVTNAFYDRNSKPVSRVDCTRVDVHCYR